jgi:hypothetical protein
MALEPAAAIDDAQRTAAKVAGLAYLVPVAFVVYANFGMRGPLTVAGDPVETARRIAAAEPLFRLSIAFDLVYCAGLVVLIAALYVILRPVSRHLALLATLWKLVYAVTSVLMALSLLTALRLAADPAYLQALGPEPLPALVRLYRGATGDQYYVGLLFYSLASTVCGYLWLRSRYIPGALAVVGLVTSAWCVLCTLAYIVDPDFADTVNLWWFDSPMALFDVATSFWLLFRGLRGPGPLAAAPAT